MTIDQDWVIKNLLDKNGSVSRQKKKSKLTADIIVEMQSQLNYYPDDVNSLIYAYVQELHSPTCLACDNPIKVNKRGPQKFCTLECLNTSDYMRQKTSEIAQANSADMEKQKQINSKRAATNRAKYGVDHVLQIKGMAQKVATKSNPKRIATMRKNAEKYYAQYGVYRQQAHWPEGTMDRLNDEDLLNDLYYVQRLPIHEIAEHIGCSGSRISAKIQELGWHRHLVISTGERQIYEHLLTLVDEQDIITRDRKTFSNKIELDFHIPSCGIAIEYHGLYWHSFGFDEANPNSQRHKAKYEMCRQEGIHLIQIFEDEWRYKQDICKSMISNALGMNKEKIYGRNTRVQFISHIEASEFLQSTHINGYSSAKYKVGLYHGQELVSIMTFSKPRFSKKYDYEIIRFASKLNTTVVGGASKMLKFFEQNVKPKSIITYADLRFGSGEVYKSIGFQPDGLTDPGYFWFYNKQRLSRYQTQKQKLVHILGPKYDSTLSESVNMFRAGGRKIFDAGHARFSIYYK